jgi:WD40 repeat protein
MKRKYSFSILIVLVMKLSMSSSLLSSKIDPGFCEFFRNRKVKSLTIFIFIYSGTILFTFNNKTHSKPITSLCPFKMKMDNLSASREFLASSSFDESIKVWDIDRKELAYTFDQLNGAHSSYVLSLAHMELSDNIYLGSGWEDGQVKVFDLKQKKLKFTFDRFNGGHSSSVYNLVAMNNGMLASGSWDSTVKVWDLVDGKLKFLLHFC